MYKIRIKLLSLLIIVISCFSIAQDVKIYSTTVDSGFFFLNGKYIESPYNFEVIGLAIYINGLQLNKELKFPQFDNRVLEDPGPPIVSPSNITIYAMDSIKTQDGDLLVYRRIRYYSQNYSADESYTLIFEFLQSLLFIESIKIHGDYAFTLEISDKYGNNRLLGISPVEVHPPPLLSELENGLIGQTNRLKDRLNKAGCILYFTNSGEMSISDIKTAKVLPKVLEALEASELNVDEKKTILDNCNFIQISNLRNEIIINNYIFNEQLHERLIQHRNDIINCYGKDVLSN